MRFRCYCTSYIRTGTCYSTAEHCSPLWSRSAITRHKSWRLLNDTMHIITGPMRSTQTHRLPFLSKIPLPAMRWTEAVNSIICKIEAHEEWPLYVDVFDHPSVCLISQKPIWLDRTPLNAKAGGKEPIFRLYAEDVEIGWCLCLTLLSDYWTSIFLITPGH